MRRANRHRNDDGGSTVRQTEFDGESRCSNLEHEMSRLYLYKPWHRTSSGARSFSTNYHPYGWKWPLKPVTCAFSVQRHSAPLKEDSRTFTDLISDYMAGIILVKQGMFKGSTPSNLKGWDRPPYHPSPSIKARMLRLLFYNNSWYRTVWMGNLKDFLSNPPAISLGISNLIGDIKTRHPGRSYHGFLPKAVPMIKH